MSENVERQGEEPKPLSRREQVAFTIVGLVFLFLVFWIPYCTVKQAGWGAALRALLWLTVTPAILYFAGKKFFAPFGWWPTLGLVVAATWLYLVGSYAVGRDILLLVLSFIIPMAVSREARAWVVGALPQHFLTLIPFYGRSHTIQSAFSRHEQVEEEQPRRLPWRRGFAICVAFLLLFWLSSSLANYFSIGAPVRREPGRFAALERDPRWRQVKVGVALSGGGFRAVLMHAGVLDGLEKLQVPVTHISSVSGGSIIGAFYATGGRPEALREAVVAGRFNLTRSLTDAQNAPFLMFPFRIPGTKVRLFEWYDYSRTDVQADLLDRILLDEAKLSDLPPAETGAPETMLCATDLRSGALYGFHRGGVLRKYIPHPREKKVFDSLKDDALAGYPDRVVLTNYFGAEVTPREARAETPLVSKLDRAEAPEWFDAPMARVVAASGAFPGAFNAVPGEIESKRIESKRDVLLADGGITDNSALSIMEHAKGEKLPGWDIDLALSSDASALFNEDEGFTALGELTRAVDIIYSNIGNAACDSGLKKILVSPGAFLDVRRFRLGMDEKERRALLYSQINAEVSRTISKLDARGWALLAKAVRDPKTRELLLVLSRSTRDNSVYAWDSSFSEVRKAVVEEFVECADVFLGTSTLRDRLDRKEAESLYRLGQFLVAFNWPYIELQLNEAAKAKPPVEEAAAARQTRGE